VKSTELNLALASALPSSARPVISDTPPTDRTQADIPPLRILLAEDNPVNQRVAIRLLEKCGHAVTLAVHGGEALAALEQTTFDLVLMDVQMPEMDGLVATRLIREGEVGTGRRIPIVAMTAHAMKGDRERCLASGMDDYLSKPVQRAELDRVLAWAAGAPHRTPMPPSPSNLEAPACDRAAAVARLGGAGALFAEVAGLFLSDSSQQLDQIRRAVAEADAPGLRRAAHALKGAAAYVGGVGVAEVAHRLELLGADDNLTAAPETLRTLEREVIRLTTALGTIPQPVTN
jgi:CheY-like chemotaxis protein